MRHKKIVLFILLVASLVFIAGCGGRAPKEREWEDKGQWPYGSGPITALTAALDGSIWAACSDGYTARWDGTKWVSKGLWVHGGRLGLAEDSALTTARDGSIWAACGRLSTQWSGNHSAASPSYSLGSPAAARLTRVPLISRPLGFNKEPQLTKGEKA